MKFSKHSKRWLIGAAWQFAVYAAMIVTCYFASIGISGCTDEDNGGETYRTEIAGHYNILETGEKISIEQNGTWWIDKSTVYPEDDIYGVYTVNENDCAVIYFSYYIESEDEDVIDTMTVTAYDRTGGKRVENAPTHKGETLTFEYVASGD